MLPVSELARPLNAGIEVVLDGPIDPLSANASSVRLLRDDGTVVPVVLRPADGRLLVELIVTSGTMKDGLEEAWLELRGLPSPQALSTVDGRRLRASVRRRVNLLPKLHAPGTGPTRLVAIDGATPGGITRTVDGSITLTFAGVLDPASIAPSTCPLFPFVGELRLATAVLPEVGWQCVGDRFDLVLAVPPGSGHLQLLLRSFGVRDLTGRGPEPAGLVADLLAP